MDDKCDVQVMTREDILALDVELLIVRHNIKVDDLTKDRDEWRKVAEWLANLLFDSVDCPLDRLDDKWQYRGNCDKYCDSHYAKCYIAYALEQVRKGNPNG